MTVLGKIAVTFGARPDPFLGQRFYAEFRRNPLAINDVGAAGTVFHP